MKRTIPTLIILLIIAVGCEQPETVGSASAEQGIDELDELIARSRPPISDLPIPVGFKLDESKSRNHESGGFRHIYHVYTGAGDKFAVKRFYERHMPISRWVLMSYRFGTGKIIMDFEKETEHCDIRITHGGWFRRVKIEVEVWTIGPIPKSG